MFDPLTEEGSLIVSLRRELHVTQVQRDQYKLNWLELERINKLLDQKCQLLLAQRDNRSKEFEALQQRGKAVASDNIKLVREVQSLSRQLEHAHVRPVEDLSRPSRKGRT